MWWVVSLSPAGEGKLVVLVLPRMGMGESRLCVTLLDIKDTSREGISNSLANPPHSLMQEERGGMINMLRSFMYLRDSKLRGGRMSALFFLLQ